MTKIMNVCMYNNHISSVNWSFAISEFIAGSMICGSGCYIARRRFGLRVAQFISVLKEFIAANMICGPGC